MSYRDRTAALFALIGLTCCTWTALGQTKDIVVAGEGPPAELRLLGDRFVAVHRRPIPAPGPGDQWVVVRDLDWKVVFQAIPGRDIAGCTSFLLLDATIGPKDTLAITGEMWNERSEHDFVLVVYDMKASRIRNVIKTSPVVCFTLALSKSGDIWCLGRDAGKWRLADFEYHLLYRYSSEGKLIAQGIKRGSFDSGRAPESDTRYGNPRILITASKGVLVWFPGLHTLLLAGPDVQERRRWQTKGLDGKADSSLAATPDGRIFGLVPTDPASGTEDVRYRVHALLEDSTGRDDGAKSSPAITEAMTGIHWSLVPETRDRHFAGRSNELVGVDASAPVIWDRSTGRLHWLVHEK